MEPLQLKISRKAQNSFDRQCYWYLQNCGITHIATFEKDIRSTLNTLSLSPTIGRKIKVQNGYTYATYANHPRCLVFYAYNKKEIKILNFIFTKTNYSIY